MNTHFLRVIGRTMAALGVATFLLVPAVAWAQTGGPTYPAPSTSTTSDPCRATQTCSPAVSPASTRAATSSGALAFTGTNTVLIVGLGLVVAAAGVVLVRLGRRPNSAR